MADSLVWPRELLTLEDWRALPDEVHRRCELVEGALLMVASPLLGHQRLVLRVARSLADVLPAGLEAVPEAEVLVDPEPAPTVRRPDVAVIRTDVPGRTEFLDPADVLGIVEVLSPGTRRTDGVAKAYDYAEAGIGWYLIVDPEPRTLTLYTLPAGGGPYRCAVRDAVSVDLPGIGSLDLGGLPAQ